MAEFRLHGSGGHVTAELTDGQAKKADLGVGKLFLAPVGKLEPGKMSGHFCKGCKKEFGGPPHIRPEESANEEVADNLILVERGQYACKQCGGVIGEYRVFERDGAGSGAGTAGHGG